MPVHHLSTNPRHKVTSRVFARRISGMNQNRHRFQSRRGRHVCTIHHAHATARPSYLHSRNRIPRTSRYAYSIGRRITGMNQNRRRRRLRRGTHPPGRHSFAQSITHMHRHDTQPPQPQSHTSNFEVCLLDRPPNRGHEPEPASYPIAARQTPSRHTRLRTTVTRIRPPVEACPIATAEALYLQLRGMHTRSAPDSRA